MGLSTNLRAGMAELSKGGGKASWVPPSFWKSVLQVCTEGCEAVLYGKEETIAVLGYSRWGRYTSTVTRFLTVNYASVSCYKKHSKSLWKIWQLSHDSGSKTVRWHAYCHTTKAKLTRETKPGACELKRAMLCLRSQSLLWKLWQQTSTPRTGVGKSCLMSGLILRNGCGKNQKNISWQMKIIWNPNFCVHKKFYWNVPTLNCLHLIHSLAVVTQTCEACKAYNII